MCYIGKATKIFIFLITVLIITALILGFGLLRRTINPKSHKCSGESCSQSQLYPPPDFPIPSTPDPPSDLTSTPPPPPPGVSPNLAPPPPVASIAPPPSHSSANQTPPPPVVVVAPPPGFNPVIRFR